MHRTRLRAKATGKEGKTDKTIAGTGTGTGIARAGIRQPPLRECSAVQACNMDQGPAWPTAQRQQGAGARMDTA